MIDSTKYREVYETTGEVLQNVAPIMGINEYLIVLTIFGVIFFLYKKLSKNTGPKYIY
jgi:hypothetical protein